MKNSAHGQRQLLLIEPQTASKHEDLVIYMHTYVSWDGILTVGRYGLCRLLTELLLD